RRCGEAPGERGPPGPEGRSGPPSARDHRSACWHPPRSSSSVRDPEIVPRVCRNTRRTTDTVDRARIATVHHGFQQEYDLNDHHRGAEATVQHPAVHTPPTSVCRTG